MGSRESLNTLLSIYEKSSDKKIKEKLVFSFSQHGSKEAFDKLVQIAKTDPDVEVKGQAIVWLGQSKNEKSYKLLLELYDGCKDPKIKKKLIFGFSQIGDMAFDKLVKIAKNDPDAEARKQAIFWLGQSNNPKANKILEEIVYEK